MKKMKISSLIILLSLIFSLTFGMVGFVSAQQQVDFKGTATVKVLDSKPSETSFGKYFNFFGLTGVDDTWTWVIVSFLVLLIIASALFDILGLIAFESNLVKGIIAVSVALISSMVGIIRLWAA